MLYSMNHKLQRKRLLVSDSAAFAGVPHNSSPGVGQFWYITFTQLQMHTCSLLVSINLRNHHLYVDMHWIALEYKFYGILNSSQSYFQLTAKLALMPKVQIE